MNKRINIPNALSAFRIVAFPVLLLFAWEKMETAYISLMFVSLFSDLIDGYIARKFKQESTFGAKLDSYGDVLTMIAALLGVFRMKWQILEPYKYLLGIFLGTYLFFHIIAILKYKGLPSFHLYSWKLTAILLGIYFFILFLYGVEPISFYLVIGIGIYANLEETILLFMLPQPSPNLKSLFWVLKNKDTISRKE